MSCGSTHQEKYEFSLTNVQTDALIKEVNENLKLPKKDKELILNNLSQNIYSHHSIEYLSNKNEGSVTINSFNYQEFKNTITGNIGSSKSGTKLIYKKLNKSWGIIPQVMHYD